MAKTARRKPADPMMALSEVRASITRVWLIGAGFSAIILVVASILRGQADAAREVWSWFLPLVLPTIGLMVGVLGAAAMSDRDESFVRSSFVGIAWWLSAAYLAVLSLTVLLEPFSPLRGAELHGMSNYWMGPFQGLVVGALGYLFTSGETTKTPPPAPHETTPPTPPAEG
jgi:hypothetical protein